MDEEPPMVEELVATKIPQFLKLQKSGLGRQARAFRLRQGDVLVAIDGNMFFGDSAQLQALLTGADGVDANSEEEDDDERVLHFLLIFWREGAFFDLVFDHPLVARYDFSTEDESLRIAEEFKSLHYEPKETYLNYEVFKDIYRNAGLHQLKEDPIAAIAPLLWMLNHRLIYPMIGVVLIYTITLLTHWILFIVVYILVCVYTKRAQFNLLRSYQLFEEKYFWMVFAATSEVEARGIARTFDNDLRFPGEKVRRRKKKSQSDEATPRRT
jgi:hypothetical protein